MSYQVKTAQPIIKNCRVRTTRGEGVVMSVSGDGPDTSVSVKLDGYTSPVWWHTGPAGIIEEVLSWPHIPHQGYEGWRWCLICGQILRTDDELAAICPGSPEEAAKSDESSSINTVLHPPPLAQRVTELEAVLYDFVEGETEPCRFDHHGFCQQHGWLAPGRCHVARGRQLLGMTYGPEHQMRQEDLG